MHVLLALQHGTTKVDLQSLSMIHYAFLNYIRSLVKIRNIWTVKLQPLVLFKAFSCTNHYWTARLFWHDALFAFQKVVQRLDHEDAIPKSSTLEKVTTSFWNANSASRQKRRAVQWTFTTIHFHFLGPKYHLHVRSFNPVHLFWFPSVYFKMRQKVVKSDRVN